MRAFTLIELLTVIAIIAILAAILIPTVSSVRVSANKTKTKVQFSQWAGAIEAFRSEYGYAPQVTTDNLLNATAFFAA
ncbi:MAG TPA: prepilin-type N-terminal cleavage/methylation domain-containing protein, partial [Opitutus sp.]|nr:prepilin-type N-terminal cleavage/methylation domain-containing protein [Opitutus sp.]